jgi:hypothetical protein
VVRAELDESRLARVLARALDATIRRPPEELVVSDGAWRWRVSMEVLRRIVDDVRRESPPHAIGRERVQARTDRLLEILAVDDLPAATVSAVGSALRHEGSIGVICADARPSPPCTGRCTPAACRSPSFNPLWMDRDESDVDIPVVVLPANLAKGLEFDHVIVVEPDAIVRAEPRGLARL